jgi:hypothetical protein
MPTAVQAAPAGAAWQQHLGHACAPAAPAAAAAPGTCCHWHGVATLGHQITQSMYASINRANFETLNHDYHDPTI